MRQPIIPALVLLGFATLSISAQTPPSFAKDIAPILANNCAGCHSTTAKIGGLDLQTWDGLSKGGKHGIAVVPGNSAESRLYQMVAGKLQPSMPMGGDKLAAGDIEAIRKWIDAGAKPPAAGEVLSTNEAPSIQPKTAVKPQIFALSYRPDGKLIALAGYKEVRLLDSTNLKPAGTLTGHAEDVRAIAFSPDGKLLAAAGGLPGRKGEVILWDVERRAPLKTLQGHADCIYAVAFSADGKLLATSSYDRLIKLWNVETGQEARTLKDHIDAVYALAFTPDGKHLVSGAADRTVKIWDTATGERLYTLGEPADGINTIALDPTGKFVAAGGLDKTIRVWSLGEKNGKLANSLIAHEDAILKLAWSPDGQFLISASADKSIKVMRAQDLAEIKTLPNQSDWIYGLAFAPDGKSFAAGRFDGTISIYDTDKFHDLTEVRRAAR